MSRIPFSIALAAMLAVSACGGGNPFSPVGEEDGDTAEPDAPSAPAVPEGLAENVTQLNYDPADGGSLSVEIQSLDTTPFVADYARRPEFDINGYRAFAVQEDALDRFFLAMVRESPDGSVQAGVVGDGGQFETNFGGASYTRSGDFDPPEIGDGPGAGQVSYAGNYVAVLNGGGDGSALTPPSPDVDPVLLPGQPGQIRGEVFLNANFADMQVNGAIFRREIVGAGFALSDVILLPTEISELGEFSGEVGVETRDDPDDDFNDDAVQGTFGGIFAGEDAAYVAGLVRLEPFEDDFDNEIERGVFVISQCNQPDAAAVCANVAQ